MAEGFYRGLVPRADAPRSPLHHARLFWIPEGALSVFPDGAQLTSVPATTAHYHVIAHRLGYADDLMAYCREHDFFHHFVAQWFYERKSDALFMSAHNKPYLAAPIEELAVMAAQRWVRANERPIVGGCDWDRFKAEALAALAAIPSLDQVRAAIQNAKAAAS